MSYIRKLRKQLEDLNYIYDIEYLFPPKKDAYKKWKYYNIDPIIAQKQIISLQKPTIILEKLLKYKKPILYIDNKSNIYHKININKFNFDIGYVYKKNFNPYKKAIQLFNYTKHTIKFLELWKYLCDNLDLTYYDEHQRFWLAINIYQKKKNIKTIDITNEFRYMFKDVKIGIRRKINV